MIYNTIMVQLDIDAPAEPRLSLAWEIARRFEADLIAFVAAGVRPPVVAGDAGAVVAELMQEQQAEIEERISALKEDFLSFTGESERASWRSFIGSPTDLLATHGRAADLIVTGNVDADVAEDSYRHVDVGTLVLSAGRPILVASAGLESVRADSVLVAWKDTREARRAVTDALPFLASAQDVLVATVEEGNQRNARESAADVVRFLMKHGVKARSDVMGIGGGDAAEALADMARQTGADLIVSGGYGHSRLREWVFGGVTRSFLDDRSFNRLVSH
ncbi:MAG: universal stress protein [Pseudaminobacter sp.]